MSIAAVEQGHGYWIRGTTSCRGGFSLTSSLCDDPDVTNIGLRVAKLPVNKTNIKLAIAPEKITLTTVAALLDTAVTGQGDRWTWGLHLGSRTR